MTEWEDGEHSEEFTSRFTPILDAPDWNSLVHPPASKRAREYEQKVQSVIKSAALGSFRNEMADDGAAFLYHGPGIAAAAGGIADASERAAKVIDMLTLPENPWFALAMTAIPLIMQLARNHEQEARMASVTWREARKMRKQARKDGTVPERNRPSAVIRLPFGRKLTIALPVPSFSLFIRLRSRDPRGLIEQVLSDPKLLKALEREGIRFSREQG